RGREWHDVGPARWLYDAFVDKSVVTPPVSASFGRHSPAGSATARDWRSAVLRVAAHIDDGIGRWVTGDDGHEIGCECRPSFPVQMHYRGFIATVFQACQGLFNHADGAFNDLRTPGDNRRRLLAAQHRFGHLGGITQIGNSSLENINAGGVHTFLERRQQIRIHLLWLTDQRCLAAVVERIVGVCAGHVPYRRLGLDPNVIHEILDAELRGSRVDDAPYDHGRDMDGIAVRIIDL